MWEWVSLFLKEGKQKLQRVWLRLVHWTQSYFCRCLYSLFTPSFFLSNFFYRSVRFLFPTLISPSPCLCFFDPSSPFFSPKGPLADRLTAHTHTHSHKLLMYPYTHIQAWKSSSSLFHVTQEVMRYFIDGDYQILLSLSVYTRTQTHAHTHILSKYMCLCHFPSTLNPNRQC